MQIEQLTQERDHANTSVEELTRQLSATCESFELHQQAAHFGDEEQTRMMEQLSSLDQELNHVKMTAEEQISAWQRAHSELQQQLAHWQAEAHRLEEALQSQHYSTTPVQVDSYSHDEPPTTYGESSYQTNSYGYDASSVERFEETAVGFDSEAQESYAQPEETVAERDDRPLTVATRSRNALRIPMVRMKVKELSPAILRMTPIKTLLRIPIPTPIPILPCQHYLRRIGCGERCIRVVSRARASLPVLS